MTRGWKSGLGFQQNPPLEIGAHFGPPMGESSMVPFRWEVWGELGQKTLQGRSHGLRLQPQPGHPKSHLDFGLV